jgi:hypothetical protein
MRGVARGLRVAPPRDAWSVSPPPSPRPPDHPRDHRSRVLSESILDAERVAPLSRRREDKDMPPADELQIEVPPELLPSLADWLNS